MNSSLKQSVVSKAIELCIKSPPDMREIGDSLGEINYIRSLEPTYHRTTNEIATFFDGDLRNREIVELGAFLGIVSKSLSLSGANVTACDIPEFFNRDNVKKYYNNLGVNIIAFNLRDYKLPFPTGSVDCIIACETFEHLNFNPLPVIAEVNRVLKRGGLFYVTMPNGSMFLKRIKYLLTGCQPNFKVSQLFSQLDPMDNMVVGLHWREYSKSELIEMVCPLGFNDYNICSVVGNSYADDSVFSKLFNIMSPFKDTLIAKFTKTSLFKNNFHVCDDS